MAHRSGSSKPSSLSTSVGRAFDLLELLCEFPEGLRQKQISDKLNIPKSSTHSLVKFMVERQYLREQADAQTYALGPMTHRLGSAFLDGSQLELAAMPVMSEIQRLTGEVVNLSVLDDCDVVLVARKHSTFPLRVVPSIGARMPAHVSAAGKAILATLDEAELERRFGGREPECPTPRSISTYDELKAALVRVRAVGVAFDLEESHDGITAVGSAVRGPSGDALGGLSIVLPAHRMSADMRPRYADLVRQGSVLISRAMGHEPTIGQGQTLGDLATLWSQAVPDDGR
jgi:DNA-binding IclR family transcriptional regulator